jgi:hypothetical protein
VNEDFQDYPAGRQGAGALPWLVGGALVVVAVFGIAFAVLLTGNATSVGSPPHNAQTLAPVTASSSVPASAPSVTATPSATPSHKPTHKTAQASPTPTVNPTPASSPQPHASRRPPKPTPTPQLAASVSVDTWGQGSGAGQVFFTVNDPGSGPTGQITVTITLPAGASMSGGGGGFGDEVMSPSDGNSGWMCQATSTGAACQHAGLSAGGQTWGGITYTLSGSTACGQPVELTATSGSLSASAQSSDQISC